jgi:hypothetical protein
MRRQLETTLENLRTDRLDVYFLWSSRGLFLRRLAGGVRPAADEHP